MTPTHTAVQDYRRAWKRLRRKREPRRKIARPWAERVIETAVAHFPAGQIVDLKILARLLGVRHATVVNRVSYINARGGWPFPRGEDYRSKRKGAR